MNAKVIGAGLVVVVAVAAGVYFGVLSKGGSSGDPAVAKDRAEKFLASVKDQGGNATYKSAEAAGNGVVLKDVEISRAGPDGKPMKITVGEVRISEYDWNNPKVPTFATFEYRSVRIPAITENDGFKEFASTTGLTDFVINFKGGYRYDPATKTMEMTQGDVEVPGLGTLSMTAKLDGIDLAQLQGMQDKAADPTKLMGLFGAMRIHALKIAFRDAGALAKVFKMQAQKSKTTEDAVKKQALDSVAAGKSAPFKIAREAAAAAEAFLKSPGTITVEATPKAAYAIAQLMGLMSKPDPAAIDKVTEELGLTVRAN